mmetsp:Transcript_34547/g.66010  ORF Transcript_34547/g.66010 Transcript_34547/m.66010 type:complete len:498 (-) Transcript_34547:163-1656(-)|eukprot:CAMPEP_0114241766 /NCGR_PEP_ID=MMETSP0058-20121206/9805_1 /TAXON_ID=36894 /ORGANISM="Pyramimonas parkeae, CCMP726" /LENGTH=497 /DNA_ID=CAMNT_0001354309 /DNA_START=67 /DNA_END=1560 /DNA_ORIENTATION=+
MAEISSAEMKLANKLDTQCEGAMLPVVFSPNRVVEMALELAEVTRMDTVCDLGCGDGRALLVAANNFNCRGYGIDIRPSCIHECNKSARIHKVDHMLKFKCMSFEDLENDRDWAGVTVVYLYLVPNVIVLLRDVIVKFLQRGGRLVTFIHHLSHLNMKLKARKFTYRGQLLLYTKESLPATSIDLSEPSPGVAGIDVSKKLSLSATNPRDMPLFVQQAEAHAKIKSTSDSESNQAAWSINTDVNCKTSAQHDLSISPQSYVSVRSWRGITYRLKSDDEACSTSECQTAISPSLLTCDGHILSSTKPHERPTLQGTTGKTTISKSMDKDDSPEYLDSSQQSHDFRQPKLIASDQQQLRPSATSATRAKMRDPRVDHLLVKVDKLLSTRVARFPSLGLQPVKSNRRSLQVVAHKPVDSERVPPSDTLAGSWNRSRNTGLLDEGRSGICPRPVTREDQRLSRHAMAVSRARQHYRGSLNSLRKTISLRPMTPEPMGIHIK